MMKEKRMLISKEEYIADPCRASSLAFWKAETFKVPSGVRIYREDEFDMEKCCGTDEQYFKLVHTLSSVPQVALSDEYVITRAEIEEFAYHINECYVEEGVTADELKAYTKRDVYNPSLWIAIRERKTARIVASGIAEFDSRIGEGILEWIQVSPDYRRKGLGRFIVCELLSRMSGRAEFVTVSGRLNSASNPLSLYKSCGFGHQAIWHIVRE